MARTQNKEELLNQFRNAVLEKTNKFVNEYLADKGGEPAGSIAAGGISKALKVTAQVEESGEIAAPGSDTEWQTIIANLFELAVGQVTEEWKRQGIDVPQEPAFEELHYGFDISIEP